MMRILWLAPNFNHYKARFLNHLAQDKDINLTIVSGTGRKNKGDQELDEEWVFKHIKVNASKKEFGKSKEVKKKLKVLFKDFDWVLIPAEKKNLPLVLFAKKLRKQHPSVKLFSYNHPSFKSGGGKVKIWDKGLTKWFFKKLDKVIFYTENSCHWAVKNKLINPQKAFWANNTIDDVEIKKNYSYQNPPFNAPRLLFIGRLIASKRISDLIEYYNDLKTEIPNLELEIIGDGPEQPIIKNAVETDKSITWHGTLVDEEKIAPIMKRASLVFVPGHSGLSVNHAFAYGRPYVTLQGPSHAPEIEYIDHGKNGYILKGDFNSNSEKLKKLLTNADNLEAFCRNAKSMGETLTIDKWVGQIKSSLIDAE